MNVYVTPTLNMSRILAYLDREDHSRDTSGPTLVGFAQDLRMAVTRRKGVAGASRGAAPGI
jgi:hypothetical protein